MKRYSTPFKLITFAYAVVILWFCHHFIFRPIILDWGAPETLQKRSLPGDIFTQGQQHTRAVLVNASPDRIWPWLMQAGQDRGGFYSYQWLENLFFADMHNVFELRKELQGGRKTGDTIWLANKEHFNGKGYQILAELKPYQSFVMVGGDDYARILKGERATGSWAFYLLPEGNNKTWLIARSSYGDMPAANKVLRYFTYEVPHFIMERKMLITIRQLAEKTPPVRPASMLRR